MVTSTPQASTVLCEQIATVDKSRMTEKVGALTKEEMEKVNKALCVSIALEQSEKMFTYSGTDDVLLDIGRKIESLNEQIKVLSSTAEKIDDINNTISKFDGDIDLTANGMSLDNILDQDSLKSMRNMLVEQISTQKEQLVKSVAWIYGNEKEEQPKADAAHKQSKKIDEKTVGLIHQLYVVDGSSIVDTAKELNLNKNDVNDVLKEHGWSRPRGRRKTERTD